MCNMSYSFSFRVFFFLGEYIYWADYNGVERVNKNNSTDREIILRDMRWITKLKAVTVKGTAIKGNVHSFIVLKP